MSLMKDFRIWVFIVALLISILAIGYNPFTSGAEVVSIEPSSPLAESADVGDIIFTINEEPVNGQEDIDKWTGVSDAPLRVTVNGNTEIVDSAGELGVAVKPVSSHNIDLGLDLVGGTRIILKPNFTGDLSDQEKDSIALEIIQSLETRTNVYGLKEFNFRELKDLSGDVFIQIETSSASEEEIRSIIESQGIFEAYIPQRVDNNTLFFNRDSYDISVVGGGIEVLGNSVSVNETFRIGGDEFLFRGFDNESIIIDAKVYDGSDINFVHTDSQNAYVAPTGTGFTFTFGIVLSEEGTERFARATRGLDSSACAINPGAYLSSPIVFYLDGIEASSLSIGCSLQGAETSTIQISGGREERKDAENEMRRLQSILKSGSLPVDLEIIRVDSISPTLGSNFLRASLISLLVAIVAVASIVFIRYRRPKIALPMIGIMLSETVMILGLSSMVNWTIDLASIAGIVAAVGTGVDDQIIIVDESTRMGKIVRTAKDRLKRAFFIVFSAAGTSVAAMLPLAFSSLSLMRGFGITTIMGILIGVLITRPAFGRIIEKLVD